MSLLQYGFCCFDHSSEATSSRDQRSLPQHVSSIRESGLGRVEYDNLMASNVPELTDPSSPPAAKKSKLRGNYATYSPQI